MFLPNMDLANHIIVHHNSGRIVHIYSGCMTFLVCRSADVQRREEYKQRLSDMKERLESRPLLFERASQVNACKSAEGKYTAALRRAGLKDEQIKELLSQVRAPAS